MSGNKRFRKIREEDLPMIMDWRMRPNITKYMYTDPKLTLEGQKKWFEKISADSNSFYWIFEVDGAPMGVENLADWDRKNNSIHSGGYIAEASGRGLENVLDVNMNLFNYAFEVLKVNRLAAEIMDNNMSQLSWMKRFGFKEEGVGRQEIIKDGRTFDIYHLSILASEWPEVIKKVHFNRIEIE
ncbi:MAG: UDP-4-amino-4,6-dideoxy-N-acetyl-beta-L-altrosamine N-acetyltransferase [Lachnospiraceae bacterium]|jgi:UDP-4-amino-4,6-dideoxy-N-acetyl-beta-L-altrosamine N-acetyltransferase|nr:UDP-4-amino-4,6-dideoxy-N-acetyl-beta-L-altrosamine N-acetyltransferase [Lachnospiraceae bacterium]MEE3460565.1 UDP-4-amino-4,6-dideoxy-N-acetyl-beta-L-altrosamine N-acetyltransferase [Lachnospiraceae bacterium]